MRHKVILNALILGTAQLGGKILSLIFLFKFASDIKDIGLYYYTYAYIPFSLFLDLSAFGLIPGVSKYVSCLISKNEFKKVNYLLKVGSYFSLFLGLIFFLLINFFNNSILSISLFEGYTNEQYNIILKNLQLASYSIIIFPLNSFYKGFLQGHLRMLPSATAILLEHISRLLLYLLLIEDININVISLVFKINFLSYSLSTLALLFFILPIFLKPKERFHALSNLYKMAIPFGIVTMFFTFYQLVDSITLASLGLEGNIYTAYMFETIRLIFIPIVFAQGVGGALNPKINSLCNNKKISEASGIAKKLTNLMIYILIPIIMIYRIFDIEIYSYFYQKDDVYYILADVSIMIFFIGFYKTLIGISQGMTKFNYIVIATFLAIIAKIILNILLVPSYSYMGAIIATINSIFICMVVSYYVLFKDGIRIFGANILALLKSFVIIFISLLLTSIFKIAFLLEYDEQLIGYIYFILMFLAIYFLILLFIRFNSYLYQKQRCCHKIE